MVVDKYPSHSSQNYVTAMLMLMLTAYGHKQELFQVSAGLLPYT